jgi:hypothetical protein
MCNKTPFFAMKRSEKSLRFPEKKMSSADSETTNGEEKTNMTKITCNV